MNSPRVTLTPYTYIIERLLEHLHGYGDSPRVPITVYIKELHLVSIKIEECKILPTLGTPLGE